MKTYLRNLPDAFDPAGISDELPLWSAPFGLKLLDLIRYRSGITVLDIGSGTGFPLTEMAMRLGDSAMVYGIDPSVEANRIARRKLNAYGIRNACIIDGKAESIPLEDASVDLITSNNGLNNLPDMGKALSECSRIAKPGAQFIQSMNLDRTMSEFYDTMEQVLMELGMEEETGLMHRHISEKRPPLDNILTLAGKHGFTVQQVEKDEFRYRFTDGTSMLNHYFIRMAFMVPWLKILPPGREDEIFQAIEQRLNIRAGKTGGINLTIPFAVIDAIRR